MKFGFEKKGVGCVLDTYIVEGIPITHFNMPWPLGGPWGNLMELTIRIIMTLSTSFMKVVEKQWVIDRQHGKTRVLVRLETSLYDSTAGL